MDLFSAQIFAAYLMGTLVGYFIAKSSGVGRLINQLIDDGFIRTRKDSDGDTVIVRWYDNAKD
jgi:hypothetical protein